MDETNMDYNNDKVQDAFRPISYPESPGWSAGGHQIKMQGDSGIEEISGINRFVVMTRNYKFNQFPSFWTTIMQINSYLYIAARLLGNHDHTHNFP